MLSGKNPGAPARTSVPANPPVAPMRLHGGWQRVDPATGAGRFALWAESPYERFRREDIPPSKSGLPHPQQVRLEDLAGRLAGVVPDGLLPPERPLPASKVILPLPVSGGSPLPAISTPVLADGRKRSRRLSPWVVQVLPLDLARTVEFLGAEPLRLPEGCEPGPDIEYWARASRLVLSLLARQRFAPRATVAQGECRAGWFPVLDDPADAGRISALIESMPRGCMAFGGALKEEGGAAPLLAGFLQEAVDACVRAWIREAPPSGALDSSGLKLDAWWQGLTSLRPEVKVSPAQAEHLDHALRSWLRPLTWATSVSTVRTCLRLEEPRPPEGWPGGTPWVPARKERCWGLTFLLQPLNDPSLLVPATEIWEGNGSPGAALLRKQVEHPEEKLLTDLARISPLWKPLADGLHQKSPSGMSLDAGEAFSFLSDVSPLLEESGVGVLVPTWWKSPGKRLGVRVRLKRAKFDSAGGGNFGADALSVFDWRLALGDEPLTAKEMTALSQAKGGLVYLRGTWIVVDPERLAATAIRWKRRGGTASILEALRWSQGVEGVGKELPILGVDSDAPVTRMLERLLEPRSIEPLATPTGFEGSLRSYQLRGLSWLKFLRGLGLGACLADDMGLGKTVQVLALLQQEANEGTLKGPTLLVCPTSVLGNWGREASRFTPDLNVVLHHGSERARGRALRDAAARTDLFVTSYALLVRDHADLVRVPWSNFILDEAQSVKNPGAKQSQAARRIEAGWRAVLTGTPVENRLRDLWSLFSITNPGYLGSLGEFEDTFAGPIEEAHDLEATSRLQTLVRPFLLRRVKSDPEIAPDLPPKIETREACTLTREQASLYQAQVDRMLDELGRADEEVTGAARSGASQLARARFKRNGIVLETLLRLKQVCDHPALMLGDESSLHGRSGKLSRLVEVLEEVVSAGERALVFTQFASFAQRLHPYLTERLGAEVLLLHGGTPRLRREEMIRRFQDPKGRARVFLLSLRAGGLGLNLTAASHVLHFDRWWNPAVEDQATDRAHRIGQKRTVEVRTMVTSGTLEETIDQVLKEKRELAKAVVGSGEQWLAELSTSQLRDLVRLRGTVVED